MSEKIEESCETEDSERCEVECDDEVEYYIKAFKRLDKTGKHTWNWAAFLFRSAWMAYRKMYLYALSFAFIFGIFEYCAFSLVAFNVYGSFSSLHRLETEHQVLYLVVKFCCWIIEGIFTGYFGNALYYSVIKKKIRKGYHLLKKYLPTSIPSALAAVYSPFICFADWISRKSQLKTEVESEVNEETVRACLNPNKENHIAVKIANVLVCILMIGAVAKKYITDYGETVAQITTEKKI